MHIFFKNIKKNSVAMPPKNLKKLGNFANLGNSVFLWNLEKELISKKLSKLMEKFPNVLSKKYSFGKISLKF